jgi:hypothetical protein
MKKLMTTRTVVQHLGGLDRVCRITKSNKKQAYNWVREKAKFPAATFKAMNDELARLDATAPATLWNQRGI